MRVKGNSGCEVTLVDESTVRKSATGADALRLARQIEKQIHFSANPPARDILAPKILRQHNTPDGLAVDMEFIAAKDFIQFLNESDRDAFDRFIASITRYIETNLAQSVERDTAPEFHRKLTDLAQQGVPSRHIAAARELCATPVIVPVGPCHGDLTLSNILFRSDQLYLIDFLDVFVESPLQDIVKLRQDTGFGWSLHLYVADFDLTKMRLALRYLDQQIAAAFASRAWYRKHYELFQLVNFMRILPYCKTPADTQLVLHTLDRLRPGLAAAV